jgi:hypothetical protein
MSIVLKINSVDRSRRVDWKSLKIQNILTNRVDKADFFIRTYGDTTYRPQLGNDVTIFNGATKIFGGVITEIKEIPPAYKIDGFSIMCIDYTRLLDGKLVTEVYENQTLSAIIADMVARYAPSGFTTSNVSVSDNVQYINFNYQPISQCLKTLASMFNYDWYVDYDKDIHFFDKEENAAPYDLNDNDGSYIFETLEIRRDNTQIKNVIVVEGGEYLGNTLTSDIQCNGVDYIYNIGYKFDDFEATLSTTLLDVGIDFSADPDDYDALWNRDEKVLKFKKVDAPSNGAELAIVGRPYLPVIIKKYNRSSIESMVSAEGGDGQYEYYINDPTINSREGAIERATAELIGYSTTISEGGFTTEKDGLRSGQQLRVVSSARNIDEFFIINKVTMRMHTEDTLIYSISLVTTRTLGMIEVLQDILQAKNKRLDSNIKKVLNLIEGSDEIITIKDAVTSSKVHNPVSESSTLEETLTAQSLDYDATFVAGPWLPEIVINRMDTTTANGTWINNASTDAVNVVTNATNFKEGFGSVSFDIDVSQTVNDYAEIQNTTMTPVDLTDFDTIRFWLYLPDAVTNITAVNINWGSSGSDGWYKTIGLNDRFGNAISTGWNHMEADIKNFDGSFGSGDITAISYSAIRLTYNGSQVDMAGVLVDFEIGHKTNKRVFITNGSRLG